MSGLDPTGYTPLLVDEYLTAIEDDELANIDPALDLQPEEPLGQINGIIAAALAQLDANILAVYRSAYADSAEGASLDAIAALTGVRRLAASGSTAVLLVSGTPGTVLPAGRTVLAPSNGSRWVLLGVTLDGTGSANVQATNALTGPITANAGTITRIETPVAGWTSVTNPADAMRGTNRESDAALRVRRRQLLFSEGNGTAQSVLDAVLRVSGVTQARIFPNDSNSTDAGGVPAHAFEVVAIGGGDQSIRDAIFAAKAMGITAFGSTAGTSSDTEGFTYEVDFSRPVVKGIGVSLVIKVDPSQYAGDAALKQALADHVNGLGMGAAVSFTQLLALISDTAGVLGVPDPILQIKYLTGSFGSSSLPMTSRQVANLQISDITLASS